MNNGKLVGFKLVGCHYNPSNGVRYPGYTMIKIRKPDGTVKEIYAGGEEKSLKDICAELFNQGVDTSAVDHWVRTGEWIV